MLRMTPPALLLAALALAGCGEELTGTYVPVKNRGNPQNRIAFGPGGTVNFTIVDRVLPATYKFDGKKVTITADGKKVALDFFTGPFEFTLDDQGCLTGVAGKYCKM
jgi:hypothetical protein